VTPRPQAVPEPRPCRRFAKRFVLNARLLAHLPDCEACRTTVLYLFRESDKLMEARHGCRQPHTSPPN